jgi:hypothetical protein
MASTGLGSQIGFKKETTWATAVTVDKFFEYESESLSLTREYYDGLGLRAGRTFAPSARTRGTTRARAGTRRSRSRTSSAGSSSTRWSPRRSRRCSRRPRPRTCRRSTSARASRQERDDPGEQADVAGRRHGVHVPGRGADAAAFSVEVGGALMVDVHVGVRRTRRPRRRPRRARRSRPRRTRPARACGFTRTSRSRSTAAQRRDHRRELDVGAAVRRRPLLP